MNKKKVLFISYGYDPCGVSESLSAYNLVSALSDSIDYNVLTCSEFEDSKVINLFTIKPNKDPNSFLRKTKIDYYWFISRCKKYIKSNIDKYNIVHHISPISLRYHNSLSQLEVPFIWGPVGGCVYYPDWFCNFSLTRTIDKFRFMADPLLLSTIRNAKLILLTSHDSRKNILSKYHAKSIIVPEIVTIPSPTAETLTINDDYIFSSGRLIKKKGFQYLIQAYSMLEGQRPKLIISGQGQYEHALLTMVANKKLSDDIHFIGPVSRGLNYKLMQNSKYCVFPGISEAFGHVNVEALSAGKPVIAANLGGPRDIIDHNTTGFLVDIASEQQYIRQMTLYMERLLDKDTNALFSKNALARYNKVYSADSIKEKILSCYDLCFDYR